MNIRSLMVTISLLTLVGMLALVENTTPLAHAGKNRPWEKKSKTTKGGLLVDDLPKPVPELMGKIQSIGNVVGKGISKAAGEGARAVSKVLKKGQKKKH